VAGKKRAQAKAPVPDITESDGGPERWLLSFLEARYTALTPKPDLDLAQQEEHEAGQLERERVAVAALVPDGDGPFRPRAQQEGFQSSLQPGHESDALAELPATYWWDVTRQYRVRQAGARRAVGARFAARPDFDQGPITQPGINGVSNWVPLGPSVVRRGQPTGRPAISGRASGIAIAPGGQRVYVATADGGVWRSDDAGASWYSTMESYDVDPTAFAATSLACGAIAIDQADPNRVYVGTGEGDTNALFASRLTSALPAYRGVGPIRSDDGGATWSGEPAAPGSPPLAGAAFYALAVDPGDRENVVGSTSLGLYRREPDGAGGHHWVQKRAGVHSSVVVARAGSTTTFFAAAWGDKVYASNDGSSWSAAGTAFPTGASRIGLSVQRDHPGVLYALAADASGGPLGVYRLDNSAGAWQVVTGAPAGLFGPSARYYQGAYDLTIAVDPGNANTIFMGGSFAGPNNDASIYRASVSPSGSGYAMAAGYVGGGAHPDVHVLAYAPGDSATVWMCCDGGVFRTTDATGASVFEARNTGLATMSANYLAQHPTQPAVIFCGFQDNGTGRFTGEECWTSVGEGDGGYPVINWDNPYKVLVYWNGQVFRATDGGVDYGSFTANQVTPTGARWYIMAQPLVTTPYDPAAPAEAETVAYGAGPSLYISADFGTSWTTAPALSGGGYIYSMVFASATLLYVGTTTGGVYRYDHTAAGWTATRLDNAAGGALPLHGLVTDIAVDPSEATLQSIFVSFGGNGDYRHVWRFDGTSWQARSGPSAGAMTSLLDIEHNALAIDPVTSTVFAGADIGVWQSADGGLNWTPLENGLPDAAVLDLQLHAASRRLRAALHGRGVFEYKLDAPVPPDVELYVRDTTLDLGLTPTTDYLNDPASWPVQPTRHWESANIKVDVPTTAGWQTPTPQIDFYQFNDKITDGSQGVAALDPSAGTVTNRVYVEVHNRGITVAPAVRVMLLLTDASVSLTLPAGYTTNVLNGTPVTSPPWQTVGIKTVTNLRVGTPQVVEFNLPSTMLPPPSSLPGDSHYCLVAILHSPSNDVFASTVTSVDALAISDRKVAQKNLHIVQFVGVPPGGSEAGQWSRLIVGSGDSHLPPYQLEFDLRDFPGRIGLLFPPELMSDAALKKYKPTGAALVKKWAAEQQQALARLASSGRFKRELCAQMQKDIERVQSRPLIYLKAGQDLRVITDLALAKGVSQPMFIRVEAPADVKLGDSHTFTAVLRSGKDHQPVGGSTYRFECVPPAGKN
jgi:hypothetical protein